MYSTAKTLSIFSVIFTTVNIVGTILFAFCLRGLHWGFTAEFSIMVYLITASAGSLIMTICMRSLCQDLDMNYENTAQRLHDLQKKTAELQEIVNK